MGNVWGSLVMGYAHGNDFFFKYIDGLVQDCSNSTALAMELLQFCTEPSIYALSDFKVF